MLHIAIYVLTTIEKGSWTQAIVTEALLYIIVQVLL